MDEEYIDDNNSSNISQLRNVQLQDDDRKRGMAVIINNETFKATPELCKREGTDKDCEKIEKLLGGYNYDVKVYKDKTVTEMKELLTEVSTKMMKDYHDSFVCFILSYGIEGVVYGKDGEKDRISVTELVNETKASLVGKKKLFFIQTCPIRTAEKPNAHSDDDTKTEVGVEKKRIPLEADVLIVQSCISGYLQWQRKPKEPSYFIQEFVNALNVHESSDILTILTRMNHKLVEVISEAKVDPQPRIPYTSTTLLDLFHF